MIFKILISTVYNEVQYRPVTLSYLLVDTTLKRKEEEERGREGAPVHSGEQ